MGIPPLPPGFVLDSGGSSQPPPPLPPGFVMENPTQAQAETEAAAMPVQNPNRFRARAPHPQLQLPDLSTDAMRAALEPRADTAYGTVLPLASRLDASGQPTGAPFLTLPGMVRGPLLGALDIGQGRYMTNEAGTTMQPTENALLALGLAAGISPAYRSGAAIAQTAEQGAPLAAPYARNGPTQPQSMAPAAPPMAARVEQAAPDAVPPPVTAETPAPWAPRTAEPPAPQSVGAAATPGQVAELSPREALAMRTQAEMQDIFTPPRPGDVTEYVPGVGLTRAEVELTPTASREAKVLRIQKPERFADLDRQRSDAYANFFDDMAGSETLVMRAKEARESQGMPLLNRAFANAKAVWTAPVLEKIDQILSSADGKRSLIASELKAIRSRIIDEDGKLETNPALLYGVRQHINDKLSAESKTLTPLIKLAEKDMLEVRSEIDRAIEQAAPGFTQFLRFWEEASRPIDVMEEMLAARKQIFKGSDRHVAFHDFDRVMKGWASERGAPGANAAKSFTDDQWQKLMNMWRSLQRTAEAERLARAPGSDTAQNLFDLGRKAAIVGGHVFGAATLNPLMNVATAVGGRMVRDWRTDRQLNKMLDVPTRPLLD